MSRAPEKIGRLFTLYMRLDLETILITVKNSILLGNTNTFEINSFSYGGVSYPTEDALSKIEEIRNYVNDTVDEVLKEILNQLPNCISNGQRIQEIHYKQVYSEHEGKTCVEYISFFIDAPNDISDLPSEIIVYPLIIKPNNEIYSFDFRFERIFIRKQGSDENAIVGIATLKNELSIRRLFRNDWRRDETSVLSDLGIHLIDLLSILSGGKIDVDCCKTQMKYINACDYESIVKGYTDNNIDLRYIK